MTLHVLNIWLPLHQRAILPQGPASKRLQEVAASQKKKKSQRSKQACEKDLWLIIDWQNALYSQPAVREKMFFNILFVPPKCFSVRGRGILGENGRSASLIIDPKSRRQRYRMSGSRLLAGRTLFCVFLRRI